MNMQESFWQQDWFVWGAILIIAFSLPDFNIGRNYLSCKIAG